MLWIYEHLRRYYGRLDWWNASCVEVVVGAVLAQNTAWENAERALQELKERGWLDIRTLASLTPTHLAEAIRSAGFYNQKAERLITLSRAVLAQYGSLEAMDRLPLKEHRAFLLAQRGIGPETADSMLLYGWGKPVFVVDAYTIRLLERLGILESRDYHAVQSMFMGSIPQDVGLYREFHALIVEHCKRHCRKRPVCQGCPLEEHCSL